jgi:hypothetical protein
MMVPQPLGNGTERGYYVFFDINSWVRERVSNRTLGHTCTDIFRSENLPWSMMT